MAKADVLAVWESLEPNENPLRNMTPLDPKSTGSTYGACGIRIDGNPDFIADVLSCLKPLLDGESQSTRLHITHNTVKPRELNGEVKHYENADNDAQAVNIRLYHRGNHAAAMNMLFGLGKPKHNQ